MNETDMLKPTGQPVLCPYCDWRGTSDACHRHDDGQDYCLGCRRRGTLSKVLFLSSPDAVQNALKWSPAEPAQFTERDKHPLWRTSCTCGWDLHDDDSVTRCPDCGARFLKRERFPDTANASPKDQVSLLIKAALLRAKAKHPLWPTDPLHAFAIIAEEFGEAAKEAMQLVYEPTPGGLDRLRTEVAQTAAVCHRFLESMPVYEFKPSVQHKQ